MKTVHLKLTGYACALGLLASIHPLHAAVNPFSVLSDFNDAAGSPPIQIDFDDIPAGTDLNGVSVAGVQFVQNGSALLVVAGADTFTPEGLFNDSPNLATNKLFPTSGANVLSPGGVELGTAPLESDGVELRLALPVSAFGFDLLFQSRDFGSFSSIIVYDLLDNVIFSSEIPSLSDLGGGAPGGADFFGIVSDSADIYRIILNENDGDLQFPDANVGYDTFRFATIPEPTMGLMLAGMALMTLRRKR